MTAELIRKEGIIAPRAASEHFGYDAGYDQRQKDGMRAAWNRTRY